MADVTVTQFAEVLKVPVDKLLAQLDEAGIKVSGSTGTISDEAKLELLTHLRRSHGQDENHAGDPAPRRITLKRKSQSELRLSGAQGRSRTVNVEVRKKRTYIKRDVLEEQAQLEQEELDQQRRAEEERIAAEKQAIEDAKAQQEQAAQAVEQERLKAEQARLDAEDGAREAARLAAAAATEESRPGSKRPSRTRGSGVPKRSRRGSRKIPAMGARNCTWLATRVVAANVSRRHVGGRLGSAGIRSTDLKCRQLR